MFNSTHGDQPGINTPVPTTSTQSSQQDAVGIAPEAQETKPENTVEALLANFVAYMPNHTYINMATGTHWPAASIDGRYPQVPSNDRGLIPPSRWLDIHRAVDQQIWDPSKPTLVKDMIMVSASYAPKAGSHIFNRYQAPKHGSGKPQKAARWRDHLRRLYPVDYEHIENYFASKLQRPGVKINHALVLGGEPGIGKDTLLEPIKHGVGPGNWHDISPAQMTARFNGWAKAVMLRINEAYHAGLKEAMSFYELSKPLFAGPPDVIRIDEKNTQEYYVVNVCGVVITTNNRTDALFIPADDRRHFIAWSEVTREEFTATYWDDHYRWLEAGGNDDVIAYLLSKDISAFDPKAPPPKTPAFWSMVSANEAPEAAELREAIDRLGNPQAVRLADIKAAAENHQLGDLAMDLVDRKQSKSWGNRLAALGYVFTRNPDTKDGYFGYKGKYVAVYARKELTLAEKVKSARSLN